MIGRGDAVLLGLASLAAVATPALLLRDRTPPPPVRATRAEQPLAPLAPPPLSAVYQRRLFAAAGEGEAPAPADAPQLAGIVGRIDRDAVALVRTADGTTRTLQIGESVDGWRLAALAIDAAFFTRGSQRVRVTLPAGDDAAQ